MVEAASHGEGSDAARLLADRIREDKGLLDEFPEDHLVHACRLAIADRMVEEIVTSKALKIYICNVMTQSRETHGFRASDHVRALVAHTNPGIVQVCLVNTEPVPFSLLERYRQEEAFPVEADLEQIRALGYQVVADNIISTENYVRHDPDKVTKLIIQLIVGTRSRPLATASSAVTPAAGVSV